MAGNTNQNFSDWLKKVKMSDTKTAAAGGVFKTVSAPIVEPAKHHRLKNLFIPHQGNDYKPHALHPHRLAFHAVAAIAIKFLVVSILLIAPISAWLAPEIISEQSQKIIALTNQLRQKRGVNLLTESSRLDQAAFAKVQDMILKQYFAHVNPDGRNLSFWLKQASYVFAAAGENLALGFNDANEVMSAWQKSPTHYANLVDKDFTEIGVGLTAGNFNHEDTTLIAQYFGRPKTEKTAVSTSLKNEVSLVAPVIRNGGQILAARNEAAELTAPLLSALINDRLTNQNSLDLLTRHPGALSLAVYDDEVELARFDQLGGEETRLNLQLAEGIHNLKAVAISGDKKSASEILAVTIDQTPPKLDHEKSKLTIVSGNNNEKIVEALIYLSSDTAGASLSAFGNEITLTKTAEAEQWSARNIIYTDKNSPVTLASVKAVDRAGNTMSEDLGWQNLQPAKVSKLDQYQFIRKSPSQSFSLLFEIANVYYKFLLVIAIVALALNIFIEIKIQHHHIIASTLGLIGLLAFLLVV